MRGPSIIYLITRAHGLRTHLLTPAQYTSLVKSKDLQSVIEILLRTDYAEEIGRLPVGRARASDLNRIFEKTLAERVYYLIKVSPRTVRRFLEYYARKFEVENVKRILRVIEGGGERGEVPLIPIPRPYVTVNYQAMLEARDVAEAVELLKETPYSDVIGKLASYRKYGSLLILEGALDNSYYTLLWKSISKVPDRKQIASLVGVEMDLKNIYIIVGLKISGIHPDIIGEVAISEGYKLSPQEITSLVAAKAEGVVDIVARSFYKDLSESVREAIEKEDPRLLEGAIRRHMYTHVFKCASRYSTGLGYVVSYLQLCEYEARNLTAIALGKELGLPEEKLSELIFL